MVNHHSNSHLPEYVSLFPSILSKFKNIFELFDPSLFFLGGPSDVSFSGCVSKFFFKRLSSHFCSSKTKTHLSNLKMVVSNQNTIGSFVSRW